MNRSILKDQSTPELGVPGSALEKHYSVAEVSQTWGLSEKTIRRMFIEEPGVLKWGLDEGRYKRGYITLRIPESVLQRVHRRLRIAS